MRRVLPPVALLLVAASAGGCSNTGLRQQYTAMRPAMARGEWSRAGRMLEVDGARVYRDSDRVMYLLNLGTIQHYAGDVAASQRSFTDAEARMQDLWTRSVTAEASKFFFNDTSASYRGQDFERVLIYLYTSLNHAQTGNLQDALVEARRADEFLKRLKVRFDSEGGGSSVYTQDAFMLWLVGLYYEMEGSTNDAFLAFRAAYDAYRTQYGPTLGVGMPGYLGEDLVRTATMLGFEDVVRRYRAETGATGSTVEHARERGEVVLIHGNGESPYKRELTFTASMPDGYVMRVAVPEFVPVRQRIAYAQLEAAGAVARTEVAEPITRIVMKSFQLQLPGIKARAVARAAVKYTGTKGSQAVAKEAGGAGLAAVVGLLGTVVSVATEAADLRSWTLLPAEIGVARLWLPPGKQEIVVRYYGGGLAPRIDRFTVDVVAGAKHLISVRTFE